MHRRIQIGLLAVAAMVVLPLLLPAPSAQAQTTTVGDCQAKITALRTATLNATFIGQNAARDQAGLVGKLDSAASKLNEGKRADAIQALTQFRDKVTDLKAQGKISPADADRLIAGANDAIACIQHLGS